MQVAIATCSYFPFSFFKVQFFFFLFLNKTRVQKRNEKNNLERLREKQKGILADNQSSSPAKGSEGGERHGLSCRNDSLSLLSFLLTFTPSRKQALVLTMGISLGH